MNGLNGKYLRWMLGGAVCAWLAMTSTGVAADSDRPTADGVLGQSGFDASTGCSRFLRPAAATARSVCAPAGVAVARSHRLYVADTDNSRVLSWPNAEQFAAGAAADLVLGQTDFQSVSCSAPSATSLCLPVGVAVDGRDRLYVADSSNNRVLRFNHPVHNGQAADLVLGQPDFRTVGPGCVPGTVGAATLCLPYAVAVGGGKVYVVDTGNNRVLRFARPRANRRSADLVLGQPDFASKNCNAGSVGGPNAQSLCTPSGVAVGPSGDVYIADAGNTRVLRYSRVANNYQAASLVLGQPDFTSSLRHCTAGTVSARTFCEPFSLALGGHGDLYVTDRLASRVLRYDRPVSNAPAADLVVGQPDFATTGCNDDGVSASTLCGPAGVTVRRGRLYLADTGNNRILRYTHPGFDDAGEDTSDSNASGD